MAREIYRTKDGRADYGFSFERQSDGTWHAYIFSQPSYQGRADGGHTTHRYTDSRDGRRYICYEPMPRSEAEIKSVAATWADKTQKYILTGETF